MTAHATRRPQTAGHADALARRKPLGAWRSGPGRFPQRWNLYQPGWTRWFQIGTRQDAPFFAVTPHMGWFGGARLKLHADEHKKSAVLAMVKKPAFTLHNRHGFQIVFPSTDGEYGDEIVELTSDFSVGQLVGAHREYQFTVPVGAGRMGTFRWRHTRRTEVVDALREGKGDGWLRSAVNRVAGAWELVRMDRGPGGGEVVACWIDAALSVHKKVTFAFLGSGATGQLGEKFAILAVVTALALWDEEQRQARKRQSQASVGVGGGT